ncbi:MAG TPA: SGNH/GDSL hydrolase family protein [Jatrophihabitans sp.]|nr:SGNH/GDSL hydrolase family protein [Jatrophihabitans sp.]
MRRSRRMLVAAAGAVVALLAGSTTAGASTAVRYVALGDSYSSGVGVGSYLAASGGCLRSAAAYPELWAKTHAHASFRSVACSGATTADVLAGQVGALGPRTTLVSISIGGNDVGFAKVMTDCVLYSTGTCTGEVTAAENDARTELPAALDQVYAAIRDRAPHAHVVVLGYPRLYHVGLWYCIGLSDTARAKINEGADVLDSVIAAAAERAGFTFADVRDRFGAGHEICDGSSWLHSVDWDDMAQSYHPTASGQSGGYLPAFSQAVSAVSAALT